MDTNVPKGTVALVESNSAPMGVQLVSSLKTNKPSNAMDLVELAKTVQKADEFTKANAGNKLTVIADQIRYLQEQAKKVLEDARRDTMLHHAACNIVKRPGTIYYLYERESGQSYLSIVSPQEWGASCPNEFLGAFRLEYDQSWTPVNQMDQRDRENALIDKIFGAQMAITSGSTTAEILGFKKIDSSPQIEDVSSPKADSKESRVMICLKELSKQMAAAMPAYQRNPTTIQRLTGRHFPSKVQVRRKLDGEQEELPPAKRKKSASRRCVVCSSTKKRKDTTIECRQCDASLCTIPCFGLYHTQRDFKRAKRRYDEEHEETR